jgi:hypothetical protein
MKGCCLQPGACDSKRTYAHARVRDVNILKWDEPDVCFAVVSDLDDIALHNLAEKVHLALRLNTNPPVASIAVP